VHDVVALALPAVEAFDLAIPSQIFGHTRQRDCYRFTVCAPVAGPLTVADLARHAARRRAAPWQGWDYDQS
jgi:hypothetical protein